MNTYRCIFCNRRFINATGLCDHACDGEPTVECSECGHLHFLVTSRTYKPCPVEGCDCDVGVETYATTHA
jgi:DNA-directed RNA polymerase subunit RPC12/RpoP